MTTDPRLEKPPTMMQKQEVEMKTNSKKIASVKGIFKVKSYYRRGRRN
jgi:hypothetical protein